MYIIKVYRAKHKKNNNGGYTMKLTYNQWKLIIELLEKVANDEKENTAKRLEAIETLKILKEQKIG